MAEPLRPEIIHDDTSQGDDTTAGLSKTKVGGGSVSRRPPRRGLPRILFVVLASLAAVAGFSVSYFWSGPPVPERPAAPAGNDATPTDGNTESALTTVNLPPVPVSLPTDTPALVAEVDGVMRHLISRFPDDPDAHEMMGRWQNYRGRSELATEAWKRCLQLNPDYPHAHEGLGHVAAKKGDYATAVNHYRRALVLAPDSGTTRLALAETLVNQGELAAAIELLEAAAKSSPGTSKVHSLLASAHLQRENYVLAKQSFETAAQLDSENSDAYFGLITACSRLGLVEAAKEHQKRFQELRQREIERRRVQRTEYDDCREVSKDVASTYAEGAQVYTVHGDFSAAELLWRRAGALHPRDLNSRQALAWHLLQQGKSLETITVLRQLAEIETDSPTYPLEIARIYLTLGRTDAAERTLKSLCEAMPKNVAGAAALAELYIRTNRKPQEALRLAGVAVQLAPTAANYVNLAAACERNNDLPRAVAALSAALEREPDNKNLHATYQSAKEKLRQANQATTDGLKRSRSDGS